MPANAVVRARVDDETKQQAAAILEATGLTLSDAFRMMLKRTVADKALPFDPLVPNEKTVEAMARARKREGKRFRSVDDLITDLNADD